MLAVLLLLPALAGGPDASAKAADRLVSLIVQGVSPEAARSAVSSAGGVVTEDLSFINAVTADVPAHSVDDLRRSSGVINVSPNEPVEFLGKPAPKPTSSTSPSPSPSPSESTTCTPTRKKPCPSPSPTSSTSPSPTASPTTDPTPEPTPTAEPTPTPAPAVYETLGSDKLWAEGIKGQGVTVAVLDTGVYNHPDLAGRIVGCVDMTHEAAGPAKCADTFGHGTFMAGLVAGNGASSDGKYKGTAPEAKIVSVKLAGYDGSSDVSHVLAGIQWAVAHKDEYGIRVMNLSLGSNSAQSYKLSPLNYAVQQAWKAGIVVVVSSGNTGPELQTVTKPADDPWVITVGASYDQGTPSIADDRVAVFSGRGPTRSDGLAKPDVVAPGVHTVSLRSPGSAIDNNYGSTAALGEYFKGTGTSMSAALVSGVAAQIIQKNPSLTPNQVKARLLDTARAIADTDPVDAGKGLVDAYAAATSTSGRAANKNLDSSTGLGLLEENRATIYEDLYIDTPLLDAALAGEFTAQHDDQVLNDPLNPLGLVVYSGVTYTTTGWDPVTWDATRWNTEEWAATRWNGTVFEATRWNTEATRWNGTVWANPDWDATRWNATDWNATRWNATRWNATRWNTAWYAAAWD